MVRSRLCLVAGITLTTLIVAALVVVLVLQPWTTRDHPRYQRAAVAANGYECAGIGRDVLDKGGSAVDAAIATLFCEGLGCAQCMGLGGGFLATVYDAKTKTVRVLNARERAPLAAYRDMYENASSTVGGLAIAVPGELKGYGALYREYGHLPWEELVRPTAELCRRGHRVTEYMGRILNSNSDRIKAEPSMSEVYVNRQTGEPWKEGDYIYLETLGKTLDIIAEEGPDAIHNGTLTPTLVQDIREFGGIITEEDLRSYRAEWQEPIAVPVSDKHTLYTVPLPGSGSVLAFIINMLTEWIGTGSSVAFYSNLYWHRTIEAFKYAYAKRTGLGDPTRADSLAPLIAELERNLSSPQWAKSFRDLVDDNRTYNDWTHYGALFEGIEDFGTANVVVVAPDGSAVCVTSTINYIWGSYKRSRSLGIILNNEMDDFAIPNQDSTYGLPPSPANMIAPGLQPLSSMVPSIVVSQDRGVELVVGAAGGTKITTQVAIATLKNILEERGIDEIVVQPRVHHQLMPMEVEYEIGFDPVVIAFLQGRGHATTARDATAGFAAMTAIARDSAGYWVPATDRRRVGSTAGS